MTISVSTSSVSNTNGASPTLTIPATPADGDWLVAFCTSREIVDGTFSMPGGWTQLVNTRNSGGCYGAWAKPWVSGDANPVVTVGGHATGTSGDSVTGCISKVRPTEGHRLQFVGATTPSANASSSTVVGPISSSGLGTAPNGLVFVIGQHCETSSGIADLTGDGLTWQSTQYFSNTSGADNSYKGNFALADNVAITDKSYTVSGSGGSSVGGGFMLLFNEVNLMSGLVAMPSMRST